MGIPISLNLIVCQLDGGGGVSIISEKSVSI